MPSSSCPIARSGVTSWTSAPRSNQTKLFFLLILTLSDDSLDKDGREAILTNLGLYDDVSDPKQLAGSVTKNGIQYILEPLVQNNLLFGLSLYTSFADTSGTN